MRNFRLAGAVVLILLFVAALVVTAPARLLYLAVPGDQLLLRGLSGTVWHGSASGVLLRMPQGYLQLGAVQWSLKPLSLLLLSPHLSLRSEWGSQTLTGELVLRGQRDLDVLDLDANVAATLLGHFAPVAVDGMFNLQVGHLKLRNGLPYSAKGRLVWKEGGWRSPQGPVPLGTFALDFEQAPGDALQGNVITLSGPLQASGTVLLRERHYEVDILIGSEQPLDAQLRNMLALISVPEGAGFRVGMKGDF